MLNTLNMLVLQFITLASGITFRGNSWQQTLPALVIGMLGIFLVIGIIILATYALNKFFSRKKDEDSED